jgi:hypothetical protein
LIAKWWLRTAASADVCGRSTSMEGGSAHTCVTDKLKTAGPSAPAVTMVAPSRARPACARESGVDHVRRRSFSLGRVRHERSVTDPVTPTDH